MKKTERKECKTKGYITFTYEEFCKFLQLSYLPDQMVVKNSANNYSFSTLIINHKMSEEPITIGVEYENDA
jgi:hypothetical protein